MRNLSWLALPLLIFVARPAAAELPWMNDDYDGARLQAQERHVPILAEVWAPW